ncbi:MAG: hypothetical protein ABFD92_10770 [Planctomycetaceae bacterium]
MSYIFQEYPKWVRAAGVPDKLVKTEDEERAFFEALPPIKPAPKLPQLDHDGDGEPGGSTAPDEDVADLRKAYQAKFGKRPFPGWKADKLKSMIEGTDA